MTTLASGTEGDALAVAVIETAVLASQSSMTSGAARSILYFYTQSPVYDFIHTIYVSMRRIYAR